MSGDGPGLETRRGDGWSYTSPVVTRYTPVEVRHSYHIWFGLISLVLFAITCWLAAIFSALMRIVAALEKAGA